MQCEILLAKFLKLFLFFQTYLPNIPINVSPTTLKLTAEELAFRRHFLFLLLVVLGTRIVLSVLLLVVFRISWFIPRSSPEYPSVREIIFFWIYFCIGNLVLSASNMVLEQRGPLSDVLNATLNIILTFRVQGKMQT